MIFVFLLVKTVIKNGSFMKFSSAKSIMVSMLAAVCISITCGNLEWGQQEYEHVRQFSINLFTQRITDLEELQQQFPTIEQAEQAYLLQRINNLIANAPQTTRDEMAELFCLFNEITLNEKLSEARKLRNLWQKNPYNPLHEGRQIHFLQQYIPISQALGAAELQFIQEVQNVPNEQIIDRSLQYINTRKALKQQLTNLINNMMLMD
jgi:hypothetical protein